MRLMSLTSKADRKWSAEFEIDGESIEKLIWVHPAENLKPGLVHKVIRALREADRDAAYRKHGKDFRAHCRLQSKFFGGLSEQELAQVDLSPLKDELKKLL